MFRIRKVQANSGNIKNEIQIIHISDMHWYYERDIILFCERLALVLQDADPQKTVIISTGDWLCEKSGMLWARLFWWRDRDTQWKKIFPALKRVHVVLKRFPHTFTCWGNHDLGHSDFRSLRAELKKSFHDGNIQTVLDGEEHTPVYRDILLGKQSVRVIITHDYCPEPEDKTSLCEREFFDQKYIERVQSLVEEKQGLSLVLTHNAEWIELHQEKFRDLSFCLFFAGHTHNGLINIPGIKQIALWKLRYKSKLIAGTYQLDQKGIQQTKNSIVLQNPAVIVSQGLGDAPIFRPLRWNCRYEIVNVQIQ